ncbi:unnamed protein product [Chrysoparadoxa australica]
MKVGLWTAFSSLFLLPSSQSFLSIPPIRSSAVSSTLCASASSTSMENVLFVEVGFGSDQHGQNLTKACVRACRNSIEFNSIPSIAKIVPGGYENMKLRVQLACPTAFGEVDMDQIRAVFPYGQLLPVEVVEGGASFGSGIAIKEMGDTSDAMVIAIAAVTVGY